jgi:hypothetical protein
LETDEFTAKAITISKYEHVLRDLCGPAAAEEFDVSNCCNRNCEFVAESRTRDDVPITKLKLRGIEFARTREAEPGDWRIFVGRILRPAESHERQLFAGIRRRVFILTKLGAGVTECDQIAGMAVSVGEHD